MEPSPRAGNEPEPVHLATLGVGAIPASGERTSASWISSVRVRSHPRGRGKNRSGRRSRPSLSEPSPRAGKERCGGSGNVSGNRAIPASGETRSVVNQQHRDIPARGEQHPDRLEFARSDGAIPASGETRSVVHQQHRVIPARGEEHPDRLEFARSDGAIPASGERTARTRTGHRGWWEPSPRAGNGRHLMAFPVGVGGAIPARGERTWATVAGEGSYVEPSPHTGKEPDRHRTHRLREGAIPARGEERSDSHGVTR